MSSRIQLSTGSCSWVDSFTLIVSNQAWNQFVRLIDIISPAAGTTVGSPTQVVARVRNEGLDTLLGFNIGYYAEQSVPWQESFAVNLAPGAFQNVSFLQPFAGQTRTGQAFCVFSTSVEPDTLCINLGPAVSVAERSPTDLALWVYPNPVGDWLQLRWGEGAEQVTIAVLDVQGKVVLQASADGDQPQYALDVTSLSPGVYILKVEAAGRFGYSRFVVHR